MSMMDYMKNKDNIYQNRLHKVEDFSFDENVVRVFPDMIERSVPGYSDILKSITILAKKFITQSSNVYDLGCSMGAVTSAILASSIKHDYKILAVDNSQAMVDELKDVFQDKYLSNSLDVIKDDVCNIQVFNASFVILNFTLQFISKEKRNDLINNIYEGLNPGAALIISEKITFDDDLDQCQKEYHLMFKKYNGYSDLEISQKRSALENILIPETTTDHFSRLKASGFGTFHIWHQHFNFVSMIAIK